MTSNGAGADANNAAYIVIHLDNGDSKTTRLYNRPGDDQSINKGDLWEFKVNEIFPDETCVEKQNIFSVAIVPGGTDNWIIESIVTLFKNVDGTYEVVTADFHVDYDVDSDGNSKAQFFHLTLV